MWWTAVISGALGGTLAIIAGALNERRLATRQRRERIEHLAATIIALSKKIADQAEMARVRLRQRTPEREAMDWTTLHDYERDYGTAFVEVSWAIKRSPLFALLRELDVCQADVVRRWKEQDPEWGSVRGAHLAALGGLDGGLDYFAKLSPGQAKDYLRAESSLPDPPTVGARPRVTRRRFGRDFP